MESFRRVDANCALVQHVILCDAFLRWSGVGGQEILPLAGVFGLLNIWTSGGMKMSFCILQLLSNILDQVGSMDKK